MDHRTRDEIQRIAVDAARRHVPLDQAVMALAPLLERGYPALEVVQAASEDYEWASKLEDWKRTKLAV